MTNRPFYAIFFAVTLSFASDFFTQPKVFLCKLGATPLLYDRISLLYKYSFDIILFLNSVFNDNATMRDQGGRVSEVGCQ